MTDPVSALDLLQVTEAGALEAYAVSTAVNKVSNNDASLTDPLPAEGAEDETEGPVQDALL